MQEKTVNAGYTIIERQTVGEVGFVIGHSQTAPSPYVTWCYRAERPNHFFWGHYKQTKEGAQADFRQRIQKEMTLSAGIGSRIKKQDEPERGR